jgi:ribonucleoside-diphosphate reductase alpha chain
VPYAKSITDYIFRWLAAKFLSAEHQEAVGVQTAAAHGERTARAEAGETAEAARETATAGAFRSQSDAPSCHYCGNLMMRNGACYRCANCGSTSGCS